MYPSNKRMVREALIYFSDPCIYILSNNTAELSPKLKSYLKDTYIWLTYRGNRQLKRLIFLHISAFVNARISIGTILFGSRH